MPHIEKKIIDELCKCPILSANIIFEAMMLMDDNTWGRLNSSQIDDSKRRLSRYLKDFEKNKCQTYPSRMGSAEKLKTAIYNIDNTEPISKQPSINQRVLDTANDWAIDSLPKI